MPCHSLVIVMICLDKGVAAWARTSLTRSGAPCGHLEAHDFDRSGLRVILIWHTLLVRSTSTARTRIGVGNAGNPMGEQQQLRDDLGG